MVNLNDLRHAKVGLDCDPGAYTAENCKSGILSHKILPWKLDKENCMELVGVVLPICRYSHNS